MTRPLFPLVFALTAGGLLLGQEVTSAPVPDGAPGAMKHIDAAGLAAHAAWMADDARGGRLTGSPGQVEAAKYIADHFESLGLEPLGDEIDGKRGFLQSYDLTRTHLGEGSTVAFGGVEQGNGWALLSGGQPMDLETEGELAFVGLGRRSQIPEGIDFAKSIPWMMVPAPRGNMGDRAIPIEQKFMLAFTTLQRTSQVAKSLGKKGAKVVVIAIPEDPIGLMDVLNYMALSPGKDILEPRGWKRGADQFAMMARMIAGGPSGVPLLFVGPSAYQRLCTLGKADPADVTRWWNSREGDQPEIEAVPVKVDISVERDREAIAYNTVAVLRGSDDELAKEAVIYSAHMDHVGIRMDGDVFNGADDNASGTAGLLEIAEAFAKGERPRRSVIFLAVSGEELGLWGSEYYAGHPTWPIDDLVANVNTDMIGRVGPESGPMEITVTPSYRHPKFSSMVRESARLAESFGVTVNSGDKYYERSDHYNFAKQGIPVVFFCCGEHEDYHQVTDHADKLDPAKMERIARLAWWTGWNVANSDDRPESIGRANGWRK